MSPAGPEPADDLGRHLRERGYAVDRPRPGEPTLLRARHEARPPLLVKAYPGAVRLTTAFRVAAGDRLRLLEAVNDFNRRSMGLCVCVNLRGELAAEAFVYATYERLSFDDFLRRVWDRELDRLARELAWAGPEPHEPPAGHERC